MSRSVFLPLAFGVATLSAWGQVSASIDIDTTHATPLDSNFSGFNDEVVFPAEFFDYRLNNVDRQGGMRAGSLSGTGDARMYILADGDPA
jgi:hypothetical protein